MNLSRLTGLVVSLIMLPLLVACNEASKDRPTSDSFDSHGVENFTVYKQPTCDCCKKWMSRLERAGFDSTAKHPADLNAIKARYRIAPRYQSCHTAVSSQGYVFEGHIPARYIQAFLANPPDDAIGLVVPGMPLGSPGMEVGGRFTPYQVLLLKKDGSSEVFANVENAAQQYQREAQP
ncbi:MAG: metal-binding protein [Porticoccaceae bacterium]|nr:metal-binding protein [Porticoccaceae bacterium]